ncbi:molybdopterin-dependent oxidoreductase [Vreelandella aquamarina]
MKRQLWIASVLLLAALQVNADGNDETLPIPEGPVILKVCGNVGRTNVGDEAHFDRAMINALPQHHFSTGTPWTDQSSDFSGPLVRELLDYLQIDSEEMHVIALNGYEAHIPVQDFIDYDVLLAFKRNGQAIPIREYGPLWVLYPFDHNIELLSETYRFRAVWQVMHIEAL